MILGNDRSIELTFEPLYGNLTIFINLKIFSFELGLQNFKFHLYLSYRLKVIIIDNLKIQKFEF